MRTRWAFLPSSAADFSPTVKVPLCHESVDSKEECGGLGCDLGQGLGVPPGTGCGWQSSFCEKTWKIHMAFIVYLESCCNPNPTPTPTPKPELVRNFQYLEFHRNSCQSKPHNSLSKLLFSPDWTIVMLSWRAFPHVLSSLCNWSRMQQPEWSLMSRKKLTLPLSSPGYTGYQ